MEPCSGNGKDLDRPALNCCEESFALERRDFECFDRSPFSFERPAFTDSEFERHLRPLELSPCQAFSPNEDDCLLTTAFA